MNHILKCGECGSYGMEAKCSCGGARAKPKPPRYSPEDKYGHYRRQYKEEAADSEDDETPLEEEEDE